jgi:hypothetical protein
MRQVLRSVFDEASRVTEVFIYRGLYWMYDGALVRQDEAAERHRLDLESANYSAFFESALR